MHSELKKRCDAVEEAYEFMLAYAAQGLPGDAAGGSGGQLRDLLTRAVQALSGLGALVTQIAEQGGLQPADRYREFAATLQRDADTTATILQLVLGQPGISSQLIDNVNASIHVRMLLTDLFVIDEMLKPHASVVRPTTS